MARALQHPVVLLLLCFSLVGAPVTYRGGASDPHPHTFIEFLMEAKSGQFDHHHHGGAGESQEPAEHEHHHETATQPEGHSPDSSAAQSTASVERIQASVSVFVVGDVGRLALVLPDHALPRSRHIETASVPAVRALDGIVHTPIAPPPR